jgi:hypothetical protein
MKLSSKIAPAVIGALLLFPAAAAAKTSGGTVLQLDARHHVMQVVSGPKSVSSYRYRGRLRGVRPGSRVRFRADGHRASGVRSVGRAKQVRVYAKVVRSRNGAATFTLPDGRPFSFGRGALQAARSGRLGSAAQNVFVNIDGLQPGQTVLITVTFDANGDLHITITLVHDNDGGGDPGHDDCGDPTAKSGTVVGINRSDGVFTISRPWGEDPHTYAASAALLDHIHAGDEVLVRHGSDDAHADDVKVVRSKVAAPDPGMGVADGTVNSVVNDAHQFTIVQSNRTGRLTLNAPCWILNQVWVSEDVHVVYHREDNGDTVADTVDANDGSEFERH